LRNIHSKAFAFLLVAALPSCVSSPTISPEIVALPLLDNLQKIAVADWLVRNPDFRIATEKDCDCDDDIRFTREKGPFGSPLPTYEPYLSVGDFNGDGKQDFGIIVVDLHNPDKGMLLIFNGPFGKGSKLPAFTTTVGTLKRIALFQSYKIGRLLIGPFESEGCVYEPEGETYREDCMDD